MPVFKLSSKKWLRLLAIGFIFLNIISYFHAYKFTHFVVDKNLTKSKDAQKLSFGEKLKTLFLGIDNPKPTQKNAPPTMPYETVLIQGNRKLAGWLVKGDSLKGTVIFFHGYSGEKSDMLTRAEWFLKAGYGALFVDFTGSGGSEGNETTIGYKESADVKASFDFLKQKGEKNIYLFGASMGAAAILKAEYDYHLNPKAILLECPFGSMYATTAARFKRMGVPAFPMAGFLVFWGGAQHGFWAYSHNPVEYAKAVKCPVILMYGQKDETVNEEDIDLMYKHFSSSVKEVKKYSNAAHESYLNQYRTEWTQHITQFMEKVK